MVIDIRVGREGGLDHVPEDLFETEVGGDRVEVVGGYREHVGELDLDFGCEKGGVRRGRFQNLLPRRRVDFVGGCGAK